MKLLSSHSLTDSLCYCTFSFRRFVSLFPCCLMGFLQNRQGKTTITTWLKLHLPEHKDSCVMNKYCATLLLLKMKCVISEPTNTKPNIQNNWINSPFQTHAIGLMLLCQVCQDEQTNNAMSWDTMFRELIKTLLAFKAKKINYLHCFQ